MAACGDIPVSDEDFKELKLVVSEWFDQRGYINNLKVLYSDLLSPVELDNASKTMDLLNSLTDLDELNSANLTLLYDTITVSKHFGIVKKIKEQLPSCPFPAKIKDIEISGFTPHRLKLIKLGSLLTEEDVAKIDGLYNEPPKNYTSSWSLIMDLEKRREICDGKMEKFVKKLEKIKLKAAVDALCRDNGEASTSKRQIDKGNGEASASKRPKLDKDNGEASTSKRPIDKGNGEASTSKRPKLDKDISDYLIAWQKKMYEDLHLINPAIWNKEYDVDIAHLFTDLNILKSKRDDELQPNMERGELSTTLAARTHGNESTLAEVLGVIESIDSCKVLITGQGGMGKTTLLRYISHNWATGKDNNFGGKLLFLINIRDLKPSTKFLEFLLEQINVEEITLKNHLQTDSVKNFLVMHAAKLVILLDGYDELERDAKDPISLFKGFEFRESIVVMTSRPENISCLLKICDVHIEVKGFSQTNIQNYIHKYFDSVSANESMGNSLISELYRHSVAFNLCSSPLLLLKICTIWKQKQLLPKDLTDLFKELFCCILNQYIRKDSNIVAISEFDRIPEQYLSAILVLGKCMYEGLKTNTLSIDRYVLTTMVESEDSVDLALKLGFVYKNSPVALDDLTEIYTPPHKLLTEALVGFYLSVQTKQESLEASEYEVIRSNEYLHMTRVFTIGFLGADAGKLLKHWLFINTSSDYLTVVEYFKYVKKEHTEPVLHILDQNMSTDLKTQLELMCESFLEAQFCGASIQIERKDVHFLQLMRDLHDGLEHKLGHYLERIITTKPFTKCVSRKLVHILILLQRINNIKVFKIYFEYFAKFSDKEIDTLSGTMEELKFKYTVTRLNFHANCHPKSLIHLLSNASNLTYIWPSMFMAGVVLNKVFFKLHENKIFLKLKTIELCNDLSGINGLSLAFLLQITPNLKKINMSDCKLSGKIVKTMVTECQRHQLVSGLNYIDLNNNNLSDIDGDSLSNLIKIAPKLRLLNVSFCKLAGFVHDLLNMCDKIGVLYRVLRLQGNDLSDIDSLSLPKFLKETISEYAPHFRWSDYCFTSVNFKDLRNSFGRDVKFLWTKVVLSGTNLASINGITLACFLKMSPHLKHLEMKNCTLSGTTMKEMMSECGEIGLDIIFELNGNDLSDIDGTYLVKLVRMICVCIDNRVMQRYHGGRPTTFMWKDECFTWSDFCFSSGNLQDLVNSGDNDVKLIWEWLDLSKTNLASINGMTIARLFKISPHLKRIDMRNCNLSGSILSNFLNDCNTIDVSFDEVFLILENNDLSEIDGRSLAKLLTMISVDCFRGRTSIGRYSYPFKWNDYSLSADNLHNLINACSNVILPWSVLDLSGINLASVNELSLASIFKIFLDLRYLNMGNCKLSGSIIRKILNKCDKIHEVLKGGMLGLRGNDLSNIDGETLAKLVQVSMSNFMFAHWSDYCLTSIHLQNLVTACGEGARLSWKVLDLCGVNLSSIDEIGTTLAGLLKISPNLSTLYLNNCNLSGSIMKNVLNECDKIDVELKDNMLQLSGNNLSNIDGQTFAKLARIISWHRFIWSDYGLSCDNLKDLLGLQSVRLPWKELYLNDINLASVNGITLVHLFIICPELTYLDMSNCKLSGSSCRNVLNHRFFDECLKHNFNCIGRHKNKLTLKGNNLSDIDGHSMTKLTYVNKYDFKWSDYCLSSNNLQDLVDINSVEEFFFFQKLDLSGINLASVSGITLAKLFKSFKFSPILNMSNCNLSGSLISNVLDECDRIHMVLEDICLVIKGNNLSDIDASSLPKLVKVMQKSVTDYFKWSDYCFTAANLQDLMITCEDVRLPSKVLDLSGINLAVINGITCLFTIFSNLRYLKMVDCNMSCSNMRDVLQECGKIAIACDDMGEEVPLELIGKGTENVWP